MIMEKLEVVLHKVNPDFDISTLSEETSLRSDLGMDSLAMMLVAMEIEDAFGFSALPAGFRNHVIGNYNSKGYGTDFWSSTEETIYYAYAMELYYRNDGADLFNDGSKNRGFSVRCIKDSD